MGSVVFFQSRPRPVWSGHGVVLYQGQIRQGSGRLSKDAARKLVADEMREIVRLAGEDGGDITKGRIALAARRLGISFSKAHRIYYGQHCGILAHEADAMRALRGRLLGERARRLELELEGVKARMSGKDAAA